MISHAYLVPYRIFVIGAPYNTGPENRAQKTQTKIGRQSKSHLMRLHSNFVLIGFANLIIPTWPTLSRRWNYLLVASWIYCKSSKIIVNDSACVCDVSAIFVHLQFSRVSFCVISIQESYALCVSNELFRIIIRRNYKYTSIGSQAQWKRDNAQCFRPVWNMPIGWLAPIFGIRPLSYESRLYL